MTASATGGHEALSQTFETTASNSPLQRLLEALDAERYRFITPTPLTHERVIEHRGGRPGTNLRDIFGWSLSFEPTSVQPALLDLMQKADILCIQEQFLASTVRVSSINDDLFIHSAYPTTREDAVFMGPDTYRFARFVRQGIHAHPLWCVASGRTGSEPLRMLDVGCGTGAGAVVAARSLAEVGMPYSVTMNDINPLALRYAAINTGFAGIPVQLSGGDALSAVSGDFDLIISNPPYLDDEAQRAYRHGGERLGRALSVRIATEALSRLAPGGLLLLYTGVAIVDGRDSFLSEMLPQLTASGFDWTYEEIDPDVFGEELEQAVYRHVDRIAAVGLIARRA